MTRAPSVRSACEVDKWPNGRLSGPSHEPGRQLLDFDEPVEYRGVTLSGGKRPSPLFDLQNVSRYWGTTPALENVSLTIEPGELILLTGPSGAGKTTLIRILAGVLRPSSGRVEIEGEEIMSLSVRDLRRHQTRCGIVEQGSKLVPQLDVHRNVLAGRLAQFPWHRTLLSSIWPIEREPVRQLLGLMGLEDRQWDLAGNLSGGQQQRVANARALISSPSIILADEPTSSLDPKTASDVTGLLLDQARKRKATLVMCSHWISLAKNDVDRILGIRCGRLVLDTRSDEVDDEAFDYLYKGTDERI